MEKFRYLKDCGLAAYLMEEKDQIALNFFIREIEEKTGILLNRVKPEDNGPETIVFCREERKTELPELVRERLETMAGIREEGYQICVAASVICVLGCDARGLLYGAGRLLRNMYLKQGIVGILDSFRDISVTPDNVMRGHQLAYRDKQNTHPAWKIDNFERYIRDLVIFGANSIEILPPRTDDNLYSSHFLEDPMEMMRKLSKIIHSLGLLVSVWYPYLSETIEGEVFDREMRERDAVFGTVPYVDELLIPAGDPGELRPREMFQASKATASVLHKYHPDAKIWIAPQVFAPDETWYTEFYQEIENEPEWLYGVCFGPWEKDTVEEMYEKLPNLYKNRIRHYPDISHNINSQFEIPDWDRAFSCTSGRESYNARPYAMKVIHDKHKKYVMGSITYSEGIHDDFNKMHWGNLDFINDVPVEESVRDYIRYFISPDYVDELTGIFLKLEDNWKGAITENQNIDELYYTMMQFSHMAGEEVRNNYRYQMLLLRIIGDFQIKKRRIYDLSLEQGAYQILKTAGQSDSYTVMKQAAAMLLKSYTEPAGLKERYEMQRLADELYEKCRIQLTTSRHGGQATERGAWLDSLYTPINDAQWLLKSFERISKIKEEKIRLEEINRIANRCGQNDMVSYYFFGDFKDFNYVVKNRDWEDDPGMLRSPLMYHNSSLIALQNRTRGWYDEEPITEKWIHGARTLYGTPLEITIPDIDPNRKYKIAVTYQQILIHEHIDMKFWIGEELIHTAVDRKSENSGAWNPTYEFDVPCRACQSGKLHLKWQTYRVEIPCVVSEIWLRSEE